jgi:hypothetical protein
MSTKKPKLELTSIGKEHRPRLEPRILLEEAGSSFENIFGIPHQSAVSYALFSPGLNLTH